MQKYSFLCFLQSIFCNFIKLFLSRYITGLAMVIGLVLLLSGIFHHFIVAFFTFCIILAWSCLCSYDCF